MHLVCFEVHFPPFLSKANIYKYYFKQQFSEFWSILLKSTNFILVEIISFRKKRNAVMTMTMNENENLLFSHQTYINKYIYLSPDGSSHIVDPHSYFDKLLSQIYIYQTRGQFIICGDFNARCGGDADYIGVDDVIEQTIIDYKKNHSGDILLDFLINSSCVMLNGRSMTHNDYTSISDKGVSVVDYAIVSQDHLHRNSNFQVIRAHQLLNETDLVGRCDPDHNISDHSVLKWQYEIDSVTEYNTVSVAAKVTIRKIDVSQIPDNFMGNVTLQRDINNTHIDITNSYSEFCNSIKTEIEDFLPVKYVTVNTNTQKKRYNRY